MAGRNSKPIRLIKAEGNKRHLTKKEMEHREKQESSLVTGIKLKEWPEVRSNDIAHKEFNRVKKLLAKIDKNDGLHESVINRYSLLRAECLEFEEKRERFYETLNELETARAEEEMSWLDYLKMKVNIQGQVVTCDKQIMAKRKMMLDIEKENLMTIAAALRAIPKKPKEEEEEDPMASLLKRRGG